MISYTLGERAHRRHTDTRITICRCSISREGDLNVAARRVRVRAALVGPEHELAGVLVGDPWCVQVERYLQREATVASWSDANPGSDL